MIGHGGTTAPFGNAYREGDVVGVQLDFKDDLMSYFHNGVCVGTTYLHAEKNTYRYLFKYY